MADEKIRDFNQGDLNKARVSIRHKQRFDSEDPIDVLVMQVSLYDFEQFINIAIVSFFLHVKTNN